MGRWFVRILGAPTVQKMKDSVEAVRSEYKAGREESAEPLPREIPHRDVSNSTIAEVPLIKEPLIKETLIKEPGPSTDEIGPSAKETDSDDSTGSPLDA